MSEQRPSAPWFSLCLCLTLSVIPTSECKRLARSGAQSDGCQLERNWSLEQRLNRSQIIFTAVVEAYHPSRPNRHAFHHHRSVNVIQHGRDAEPMTGQAARHDAADLSLMVRVKKIIRGDRRLENRSVQVRGLRDPRLCHSQVRPGDTRIFLADVDGVDGPSDGRLRLKLNSSLIPVTLRNLQKIRASVQGSGSRSVRLSLPKTSLISLLAERWQ
jgi:Agrin NtA domain